MKSTMLPWKTRLLIYVFSFITRAACRADGTVNRRLLSVLDLLNPRPNGKPVHGVRTADITVDPSRSLWFRLFVPTEKVASNGSGLPVIVFFHGGGFVLLSADAKNYDILCRQFARKMPAVVVSVNYRLSPENRFPAPYDDGFDVLKFLDSRKLEAIPANADLSRCFLAGDSAGANLAHHVACRAGKEVALREVKLVGLISIQPFFGGEERTESEIRFRADRLVSMDRTDWLWKAFLPEGSNRDHEAANVSAPKTADISELDYPATLVCVGGLDPLQDWQRRYYQWLKSSGKEVSMIEYPNAIHGFLVFPELPETSLLLENMREYIQNQCRRNNVN
ncbi:PREDICTED: probable carboxylesterase 18 [Nelumbo nucifera]|uniref:Alpha/beta hydrolase fold-3 domain-containing protein n=2 Tax=Nelumbo nucifera TaxID=4432 RepID=A0A822Z394_NELNU|nr:PREDICTED: probable carboxylesterase 18 [Nelumbo nucifera]DAD38983.1 TPA_asm: hypothetical protein HUJ06_013306 [Nelumbo nucifera]